MKVGLFFALIPFALAANTFDVQIVDVGDALFVEAVTVEDMPNAVGLEISELQVVLPDGEKPGRLSLVLRKQGDFWIEMVGKQHAEFTFNKGERLPGGDPSWKL